MTSLWWNNLILGTAMRGSLCACLLLFFHRFVVSLMQPLLSFSILVAFPWSLIDVLAVWTFSLVFLRFPFSFFYGNHYFQDNVNIITYSIIVLCSMVVWLYYILQRVGFTYETEQHWFNYKTEILLCGSTILFRCIMWMSVVVLSPFCLSSCSKLLLFSENKLFDILFQWVNYYWF